MWKFFTFGEKPYKINEYGEIISLLTNTKLKWRNSEDGYWEVTLGRGYKNKQIPNQRTSVKVHRLVALYFVPNPNPEIFTEVNHIDFDRKNCYYKNLEWTTHSQNIEHSIKAGRYDTHFQDFKGENNPKSKLTFEQVVEIREKFKNGVTKKELITQYSTSSGNLDHILKNETWK